MVKQILSSLVKHKAGIALGMAAVGVPLCCYIAVKEADLYHADLAEAKEKKFDEVAPEEVKEKYDEYDTAPYLKKRIWVDKNCPLSKKERVWIFAKNHWRTGIAILGTELLMIFSHRAMAKELAAVTGAMAILGSNYKEIDDYFKKNYPKEYAEFKKKVNKENIQKIFKERPEMIKPEPEDNRNRYYEPWSCQMFYATSEEEKDARLFLNEMLFNTGSATLFDYLASFPSSSGIILEDWMKHFGWYEGDTIYVDSSSYFGPFLNTAPKEEKIIYKEKEEMVYVINYTHTPDIEPDMELAEIADIERQMEESYEATA